MSDNESTAAGAPQYKPGDVVNGHVLTSANTWVPVSEPSVAIAGEPIKPARKWFLKKRFLIPGIAVLVLILAVAVSPKKPASVDADVKAPLLSSDPVQEAVIEVAVPDVTNQTAADATVTLEALGFKVPPAEDPSALVTATTPVAGDQAAQGSTVKLTLQAKPTLTLEQRNAVAKAESYLNYQAFSRSGLIGQLEFEGYPADVATFATDYVGADWNAQAVAKAQSYLAYQSFSREGLYDQLVFEGFSDAEANAGLAGVGY